MFSHNKPFSDSGVISQVKQVHKADLSSSNELFFTKEVKKSCFPEHSVLHETLILCPYATNKA